MATIIRVKIANGHRPQVDAIVDANPGITPDQAAQQWVARRYGDWITANLTEAFSFCAVSIAQFDVVFSSPEHAWQFQSLIGGQEVQDGA
ncbi:hypothetical protein [Methylorubrum extorquens]|uniref:hypothetical protein n=1 Tax=Methylorubrum extorquens TaxID=408 RepID=UPI001EE5D4A4|nr:hypothetical protein [Methylorubrum extorquens]MCG5249615.1 hypothetical protein [Methylorubrum extorquens]